MVTTPADIAWMPAAVPSRGAAPDETRMDAVELLVHDLDVMTPFYEQAVTLEVIDQSGATATLGRGGLPIMRLRQEKELPEEREDVREENPYQQIRRLVQLGSLDQAEAALRRLETKTAQWHYLTGIILWKRGWYSEGRSHIQRAVDMAPWNREYSETLARIMKAYYPFPNLAGLSEGSVQCNCRTFLRCYDFLFKCICRDNSIDG